MKHLSIFLAYLRFLPKSKSITSVHSPFVYQLLKKTFKAPIPENLAQALQDYREELLNNQNSIQILDLGAGSHRLGTKKRKVSAIANTAGLSPSWGQRLFNVARSLGRGSTILELGTSLGIGTYHLALAAPESEVWTLEGCPETQGVAKTMLDKKCNNVEFVLGDFASSLRTCLEQIGGLDLVYFDGNHQYQPTMDYFKLCLPKAHIGSLFIFDDIHWSRDMERAWNEIVNHPMVKVSIDFFGKGFVYFKEDQEAEAFHIRL